MCTYSLEERYRFTRRVFLLRGFYGFFNFFFFVLGPRTLFLYIVLRARSASVAFYHIHVGTPRVSLLPVVIPIMRDNRVQTAAVSDLHAILAVSFYPGRWFPINVWGAATRPQ